VLLTKNGSEYVIRVSKVELETLLYALRYSMGGVGFMDYEDTANSIWNDVEKAGEIK
jgi:hypothetical protein